MSIITEFSAEQLSELITDAVANAMANKFGFIPHQEIKHTPAPKPDEILEPASKQETIEPEKPVIMGLGDMVLQGRNYSNYERGISVMAIAAIIVKKVGYRVAKNNSEILTQWIIDTFPFYKNSALQEYLTGTGKKKHNGNPFKSEASLSRAIVSKKRISVFDVALKNNPFPALDYDVENFVRERNYNARIGDIPVNTCVYAVAYRFSFAECYGNSMLYTKFLVYCFPFIEKSKVIIDHIKGVKYGNGNPFVPSKIVRGQKNKMAKKAIEIVSKADFEAFKKTL
jgi:hypothetical protein